MNTLYAGSTTGFNPGADGQGYAFLSADTALKTREVFESILDLVNEKAEMQKSILNYMGLVNQVGREVTTEQVWHVQQGPIYSPIKIAAIVSGGTNPGDDVVVRVDPASLQLFDTLYHHKTTVGQMLAKSSAMSNVFRVKAISPPDSVVTDMEITLSPKPTVQADAVISAGTVLSQVGPVHARTTTFGDTQALIRTQTRYGIEFHELRTDMPTAIGADWYQQFEVSAPNGQKYLFPRYWAETLMRHELSKSRILTFSPGTTLDGIQTTMGLIPVIKSFGVEEGSAGPNWNIGDFYGLTDTLRAIDAGTSLVSVYQGDKFGQRLEQVVGSQFQNGAIIYNQNFNTEDAKQIAQKEMNLGVKYLSLGGAGFRFCTTSDMTSLSNTGSFFGTMNVDSELRYSAVFVPTNSINVGMNDTTDVTTPTMEVVYTTQPTGVLGSPTRVREYNQNATQLNIEEYKYRMVENFALRVMLPQKFLYYNGKMA